MKRKALPGRVRILLVAALLAVSAIQLVQPSTSAALTRRTVCAQDLYVRDWPAGKFIGTLFRGESFGVDHYSPSHDWVYGFAYGHVNKWGWVQNGWFC